MNIQWQSCVWQRDHHIGIWSRGNQATLILQGEAVVCAYVYVFVFNPLISEIGLYKTFFFHLVSWSFLCPNDEPQDPIYSSPAFLSVLFCFYSPGIGSWSNSSLLSAQHHIHKPSNTALLAIPCPYLEQQDLFWLHFHCFPKWMHKLCICIPYINDNNDFNSDHQKFTQPPTSS